MRAIIVDDEDLARALVREHLASHPDVEVVAECPNGFEAVKAVTELAPDLLFLDVQMPKLNGFEVLELLEPRPAVIFVTAHDTHALRAFEVHAVDYLLKPFSAERFEDALERARVRIHDHAQGGLAALVASRREETAPLERVLVRDGTKVHVLPVGTIDYIEARDDYVAIHAGGKSHLKQERLALLEAALDPSRFVRIHRSTILNIERLARLETYAKDSLIAVLKDGTTLQVSRSGHEKLRGLL